MINMPMLIPSSAGKENENKRPYGISRMAFSFLKHYLSASNGKGHGTHSPFVYDFIRNVLAYDKSDGGNQKLERLRKLLVKDESLLEVIDHGAGSALVSGSVRSVKNIAASSLKHPKYAKLLQRIARHYECHQILELGTSLGLTTAYLATAGNNVKVYTIEGSESIAGKAKVNFESTGLENIFLTLGDFDCSLPAVLENMVKVDMAFLDGNHRFEPTLKYFEWILPYTHQDSVIIFDDIHWSEGMEAAWEAIRNHPAVTATIDLFFLGIAFLNPDFRQRQHFKIRY
jgi:predicted O-methyltransferase YrrM